MDRPPGGFVSALFQAWQTACALRVKTDYQISLQPWCVSLVWGFREEIYMLPRITLDQQAAISLRDYSLVKFLGDLHLVPVPDVTAATYVHDTLSSSAKTHNRWSIPSLHVCCVLDF